MMNTDNCASTLPETPASETKRPRGFAAMAPNLVTELARKGGKAAHAAGTAHKFTREEAQAAGRRGGLVSTARRRAKEA